MIFLLVFLSSVTTAKASGVYQTPETFLQESFRGKVPKSRMIWLSGETGKVASDILQHRPGSLRTRYWLDKNRSAWVLDEIGKDKPITVGVVINDGKIESIRVLVFRESRGYEVKESFFTEQFKQARLKADKELDRHIDGITGATLSVRALTRLSRLALYLHQQVMVSHDAP